ITSIPEPVSMSAALLSGKVDFAPVIDATTAASLANNPALKIYQSKGGVFHTLSMQVDVAPFDDVRVRQAMKLVVDRQGIRVTVVVTPADSFWDDVWLKKSFITSNWGLRPPGPALNIAYRSTAAWNETHWKNEKFDALLDKAAVTVDTQQRADVYKAAQK